MEPGLPYQPLERIASGTLKRKAFPRAIPEQTQENRTHRQAHGQQLKESIAQISQNWNQRQQQREEYGGSVPASMPLMLRTDPDLARQKDALKSAGLEVVSRLDEGLIIATPVEGGLSGLQEKIELFLNEEKGGGKVSGIWEILDGRERLQYILSPELLATWDAIDDEQRCIVDVGIACVGERSQFPRYPEQHPEETDEHFSERLDRWKQKCDRQLQLWDELQQHRLNELEAFIIPYNGTILSNVSGSARHPDSFSCRLRLSGAGLKELVFNFPYLFEVVEAPSASDREYLVSVDASGVCTITGLPTEQFPPNWLDNIVAAYHDQQGIRVFVLDIDAGHPASTRHMSAWATAMDSIMAERDVLFIIKTVSGLLDPAQSLHALTVRCGAQSETQGIWDTVKPEVVEGECSTAEVIGALATTFPQESSLSYRTVMVHSAQRSRQPELSQAEMLRREGHGVLSLEKAVSPSPHRITYCTTGENRIKAKQVHVYRVQLPESLMELNAPIRVQVTLAYTSQPCRIGRGNRDYLSTWLSWKSSGKGQDAEAFLQEMLNEADAANPSTETYQGFRWAIGTCRRLDRDTGALKRFSRDAGTVQTDWTHIRPSELPQGLCIAVIGHGGWDNSPDAEADYKLFMSIDVLEQIHVSVGTIFGT